MNKPDFLTKLQRLIIFSLIIFFAALLSIYAVKGTFSRYAQDDYCYGYRVRINGFWETQFQSYFEKAEYVSDRFSTTFVESIVEELGGPEFVPYLTGLEILAWLGAIIYSVYQLKKLILPQLDFLLVIITGFTIVFFALYLAPDQYQILYWDSAMQVYFTPVILGTFIFGRFLAITSSSKLNLWNGAELGLLSFLAGGFSETTAVLLFTFWTILLVWVIARRKKSVFAKKALRPLIVMDGFYFLALLALALSPANSINAPVPYHPGMVTLVKQSILFAGMYIWTTLKGLFLPFTVIFFLGAFISLSGTSLEGVKAKYLVLSLLVVCLFLFITAFVTMLPSMYVTSHYPGERALFPEETLLVICVFLVGWISAELGRLFIPNLLLLQPIRILLVIFGFGMIGYIAHITPRVYANLPELQKRAQAWDARQNYILQEKAAGVKNVVAPAFESIYGITELHYEPGNWVNQCAAKYYGVSSISTVDNYAGFGTYPIDK